MSICIRIKELRKEKKMSQKDFAAAIGVDESQYSKIERGILQPTILQIIEICSIFKVSADWIMVGINNAGIAPPGREIRDIELLEARLDVINALKFKIDTLERDLVKNKVYSSSPIVSHGMAEPTPKLISK